MAKKKTKKKVARKKTARKAGKKEVLVVASKVKAYVKSKGCMCGADAVAAMSDCVYCCLDQTVKRAKANRRRTVKAQDL